MSSVLLNCGSFSDKLINISDKIYEKRKISEPITNDTKDIVDQEIFQAYQKILSVCKNFDEISLIISNFDKSIESGNINIDAVVNDAIETQIFNNSEKDFNVENNTDLEKENDKLKESIENNIFNNVVKIENIFDSDFSDNLDVSIEKARNGDEKSIESVELIGKVTNFIANFPKLDEKSERGALAWMMRLSCCESDVAKQLLEKMAAQYGYDFYTIDSNNQKIFNQESFEKYFEEKIGKVNEKIAKDGKSRFEELNKNDAQKAIETKKYTESPVSSKSLKEQITENAKINNYRKIINSALSNNDMEQLEKLAREDSGIFKKVIMEQIDVYNWLTEKVKDVTEVQERISVLSNIHKNEINKNKENNINQVEQKNKKIDDDFSR